MHKSFVQVIQRYAVFAHLWPLETYVQFFSEHATPFIRLAATKLQRRIADSMARSSRIDNPRDKPLPPVSRPSKAGAVCAPPLGPASGCHRV